MVSPARPRRRRGLGVLKPPRMRWNHSDMGPNASGASRTRRPLPPDVATLHFSGALPTRTRGCIRPHPLVRNHASIAHAHHASDSPGSLSCVSWRGSPDIDRSREDPWDRMRRGTIGAPRSAPTSRQGLPDSNRRRTSLHASARNMPAGLGVKRIAARPRSSGAAVPRYNQAPRRPET